ncbi:hypothetical protein PG987_008306 [Apiospora arundinis]
MPSSTAPAITRRGGRRRGYCDDRPRAPAAQRPRSRRRASRPPTSSRCRRGTSRGSVRVAGARCCSSRHRRGSATPARCAAAAADASIWRSGRAGWSRPLHRRARRTFRGSFLPSRRCSRRGCYDHYYSSRYRHHHHYHPGTAKTATAFTVAAVATTGRRRKGVTAHPEIAPQPTAPGRGHGIKDVEADALAGPDPDGPGGAGLEVEPAREEEPVEEPVELAQVPDQLGADRGVGVLVQGGALPGAQDVRDVVALRGVPPAGAAAVRVHWRRLLGGGGVFRPTSAVEAVVPSPSSARGPKNSVV